MTHNIKVIVKFQEKNSNPRYRVTSICLLSFGELDPDGCCGDADLGLELREL